jgi:drug/metabolite transporter (DMT)-like permease
MNAELKKAYLAALGYTLIIGLSFLFVKIALQSAEPLDILAHRFTFSFVAMLIPLLSGRLRLRIDWRRDLPALLPLALFYPVLFFAFQVFGLVHTSTSEAGIIQATIPILTMILAALVLGERTGGWQLAASLLSVAGVIFIFAMKGLDVSGHSLLGGGFILLSALSFALYSVGARRACQRMDVLTVTCVMIAVGFVAFNLIALGRHTLSGTLPAYFAPLGEWRFVAAVLYLGVLSSLVTSYLSNYTLARLEASKNSMFANLATLITIVAGVLVLGEKLEWYHLAGGAAIIAGVIGRNFLPAPKRAKAPNGS